MAISSTNYVDFSYIEEVTAGTTPATPTLQKLPITSVGLADSISTAVSEVIRSDRQTDDLVIVDSEVSGDSNYELSFTPFQPLLTALMQNDTTTTIAVAAATDIAAVNASTEFTSSTTDFVAEGLLVGHHFRIAGFTDNTIDGVYLVTAVTANNLTVSPAPPDEVAGQSISIDAVITRNGADTPKSYTFRKQLNAPSGTNAIFYYRGCMVNSVSFDFQTGSILTGALSVIGLSSEGTATAIAGEVLDPIQSYDLMNSVSSVANVSLTGLAATTEFSSFNLTINNQINSAKAIGTLGAAALAPFSLDVSASIEVYFEDTAMYNIYKNATEFSVAVTLLDISGNNIIIYLPKCKFEELSEPVEGKDNFLMESGSLRALRDAVTDCMVQLTFIPA